MKHLLLLSSLLLGLSACAVPPSQGVADCAGCAEGGACADSVCSSSDCASCEGSGAAAMASNVDMGGMAQGMCADCKAAMEAGKSDAMCADCKAEMGAGKGMGTCADCKAAMKAGKTGAMCADCKAKMGKMQAGKACACESTDCDGNCDGTCAMCQKMDGDQAAAPAGFSQALVVVSEEECDSCELGEGELVVIAAATDEDAEDCGMAECPEGMKATCESVKAAGAECPEELKAQCEKMKALEAAAVEKDCCAEKTGAVAAGNSTEDCGMAECPEELKAQCEKMKALEAANGESDCEAMEPGCDMMEAGVEVSKESNCDAKEAECDEMKANAEECPFAQQSRSIEAAKPEKDCCAEKGKAALEAVNEAKSECDAKAKSECDANQAQQAANQAEKSCCKEKGATDPSK